MKHISDYQMTRRDWLRLSAAGVIGGSLSGWLSNMANAQATNPQPRRPVILLWMNGGPSKRQTFGIQLGISDLKPGHADVGQFRPVASSVPGIQISEHLPQIARRVGDMAIIRSMPTREGGHGRATYQMRTGNLPGAPQFPTLGSLVS